MRFSSILAISHSVIAVSAGDSYGDEIVDPVASTCSPTPTPGADPEYQTSPPPAVEPTKTEVDSEYQPSSAPGGYEVPTPTVSEYPTDETPAYETPGSYETNDPEYDTTAPPPYYPSSSGVSEAPYGSDIPTILPEVCILAIIKINTVRLRLTITSGDD